MEPGDTLAELSSDDLALNLIVQTSSRKSSEEEVRETGFGNKESAKTSENSSTKNMRKSIDSITGITASNAVPVNEVTETNLTSSMSSSPIRFKDAISMYQGRALALASTRVVENDNNDAENENKNVENYTKQTESNTKVVENDTKVVENDTKSAENETKPVENTSENKKAEAGAKEDFAAFFNNMFASITGAAANDSLVSQKVLTNDEESKEHARNTSISSVPSIASAGKTFKNLFLKDIDPTISEDILSKNIAVAGENEYKTPQQPAKYCSGNDINFAQTSSNEKFHNTFRSVPDDELLLSEIFQASLAKEKNRPKTGSFSTSALSIGSALTADTNHNISPDELVGLDGTVSNGHDREHIDYGTFWFGNDSQKGEKGSTAFNTNNNGELFISEKYIGFQSFKNLLNIWTTNILIYIHDIESINNVGTILINKHRANKDLKKMHENIVLKSTGNDSGITITTVYDQTYAFYNIPEKVLAKRTLQTIWDINVEGISGLADIERTPPLLLRPDFGANGRLSSASLSNSNLKMLDSKQSFYTPPATLLKTQSVISSKPSFSNLTPVNSNNDYLVNRVSRQSSRATEDKFVKEESEIEEEIMSIDDQVGVPYSDAKRKQQYKNDISDVDENEEESSPDEKSVNTVKLANKTFSNEEVCYDESEDSFDSDEEYYNGALNLSPEEYDKKISVFDFKESSKFNYTGPLYHDDTEFLSAPEIDKEEEILAELTVDCAPGQLFEIMFSEHFNTFLIEFLENQDSSNFQPLKFGKFDKMNQEGQRYRDYQYQKKLNYPVGPSATRCMVRETILASNPDEFYKIINSTNTPDVPSGSAFNVKTCYQLRWTDNGKCFMKVSFWIEWVKSSWIKGMVEKSCKSGQIEATKQFCDILLKYCEENIHQIEMPKGKAMRSLVFNHRLSISSRKRIASNGKAKSRQASVVAEDGVAKTTKPALFMPNSPRKSPILSKDGKLEDITELDLNSRAKNVVLTQTQYENITNKIENSQRLLIVQNVLLFTVAVLLLMNFFKNWTGSDNWKKIYIDHFQKLISLSKDSHSGIFERSNGDTLLTDKELTEKLLNAIDQLISRRLENQ